MTAREVLDQAKAAGLTLTPEDGRIRVTPPNASPELAAAIVRRRSGILRLLGDIDRPSPMTEALDEYRERLLNGESKRGYVYTGRKDLDHLLGGTGPGYLTVVAARPKMGKSAFLQSWLRFVAKTYGHALLFSFEMDQHELSVRQVCQEMFVPANHHTPEHVETAMQRRPRIWIYENGRKLEEVVRRIRVFRMQHQDQAAAVFIDQLGHVKAGRAERKDELTDVLSRLKEVASEERLPIIGAHQINRGAEARNDKRPTLADLKDSGSFEEYANQVVLLFRPGYYSKDHSDRTVEVTVAANRSGPDGSCKLEWYPSTTTFGDPIEGNFIA